MDTQEIKKGVGAPKKTETGWKEDYKKKSITYSITMLIRH